MLQSPWKLWHASAQSITTFNQETEKGGVCNKEGGQLCTHLTFFRNFPIFDPRHLKVGQTKSHFSRTRFFLRVERFFLRVE
jgi:hypothetical protein